HAIDVEPIVPRLRNNRDAHLDYLRHLKESIETICDIVEEAKIVRPRDRSIVSACRVNSFPNASGSQPKSHVKSNRISLAKGVNKLPVEDQPRTNKPHIRTSNHVDSSSRLKRTVTAFCSIALCLNKMADLNAPPGQTPVMAPPLRTDDKILPHIRWVPIGKSNCYLDLEKSQSNPIYKIARRHRFHPRPESPLHLPNEEPVLGYLKFSAKGTKREVFGMPIPGSLITVEIQHASYYREYLAKVADEDAEYQKVLEESMKDAYVLPRGTLPPVVIREPESGKYQPLPEVPGKGKAKVTEEQVAHDLLSLQKHKKTSLVDQYIFQRRVSEPTGSSGHDESPYALLGQSDSEEESEKVVLGAEEGGQDEGQAGPDPDAQAKDQTGSDVDAQAKDHTGSDAGAQAKDQTGSDAGAQAEGQAGSNPDETSEGQARSNTDETFEGQAGPNPGDAEAKQLDEGFTATAYPKVQENLKLAVEEQVLLEEPASSSGALSSLQHLSRDFSIGDQFFSDKPSNADKKAETKVESMVNFTIQQALSSISLMTSPIIDLTSRPESPKEHQQLKATTTNTTTFPPPQAPQQSTTEAMMVSIAVSEVVTDAVDWAMQAPLRNRFRDLPEADMKKILHQRMWEFNSYKSHDDHMQLFEALEKSMNRDHSEELAQDLAEARKKKRVASPLKHHLGLHLISHLLLLHQRALPELRGLLELLDQPKCHHHHLHPEYQAWTTTDIRLRSSISLTLADLEMDEDVAPDEQAQSSNDEDIGSAHIPTTGDIATFMDWFCKRRGITELKPQDLEGPAYEIIKVFHPDVIHLQYQMEECHKLLTDNVDDPILRHNISKPLPLGGPPGQVTIQSDFFFNKDLEYLRYDSKGRRLTLSISKMKVAYYPDAGLKQMVPDYAVRIHMRILSVVRIEVFSMYGYNYMKKIVLRHADLNEYVIVERDFKYLYLSDFEDLYLLNLQGHLNHLPPKDKKILTTAVNLWTRQLHDYTVIDSPRAAIFRDKYGVQMMMRVNEIHKFSDSMLQQIDEALDYRIKEFRINRMNPGLNTRFWTRKDVDRSKAFMFAIQRRLKTRRIFRSLESFVGGRVRKGDYRLLKRTE
nr:histone deacetylase 14 [Tanacetum cinerariifolium]